MAVTKIEKKALCLLDALERTGRTVSRVSVEGQKIELELVRKDQIDEFERIDLRYDKT